MGKKTSGKIPYSMRWLTSILYRFVIGAFGQSMPRNHRTNYCPIFWVVLLGMTVGLPFVLIGWLFRLIFGQGRAQAFGSVLNKIFSPILHYVVEHKKIQTLLLVLILLAAWAGYTIGNWDKLGWLAIFVFPGGILAIIILCGILYWLGNKYEKHAEKKARSILDELDNPEPIKKRNEVATVLLFPFKLFLDFFIAIGCFLHSFYKQYCPYEELP